ncbi:MAG: HD-GYP domain-containing protein [Bacillota bacterium]
MGYAEIYRGYEYQNRVKKEHFYVVRRNYYHTVKVIKDVFNDLSAGKELDYKKVLDLSESIYSCSDCGSCYIRIITELKELSDYTYIHSINTAFYSMLIGKWLGFPGTDIKKVIQSGLLHDIGKAKIPDKVLNKKGVLNKDEMEIMQRHPIIGYEMLNHIKDIDTNIKRAVLLHHMRLDGSGYPLDSNADCIGIITRIVAVADVFDAMTSDRVYKKRVTPLEAFEMFKTDGIRLFDQNIVNVFLDNLPAYLPRRGKF